MESPGKTTVSTARPTAAEVMAHPEYPNVIWKLTPTQSGMLPVARGRGGPFNISWEVHGSGDIKLVWIMGLGALKTAWQRQTLHFGHNQGDKYSTLVLDNRGIGASDTPIMRYSTSEMAKDVIEIVDHLGWTSERQLHIMGFSMGGMIAQEIGVLIPNRVASLNLISTAACLKNTTSFMENIRTRLNMFIPRPIDRIIADSGYTTFPDSWLDAPDCITLPTASTPGVVLPASGAYTKFSTNFERFAAQEATKRLDAKVYTRKGLLMQAVAVGWHNKSPSQLKALGDSIGRERILVMHGTRDYMITVQHGRVLIDELKPGTSYILEGSGHILMFELNEWHNEVIEAMIMKAEAMGRG